MFTCGIVLAGGQSSRMGTNKSLLPIQGKSAIAHIVDELSHCTSNVIVIANERKSYLFLNKEIYSDRFSGYGPLAGLESALFHQAADIYYLAACDMPFVSCKVYNYLAEQMGTYDVVIPIYKGREHPLAGIYRRNILPQVQHQIERKNLRMNSFHTDVKVKYVESYGNLSTELLDKHFFNMNNPEQYETAKRL